MEMIMRDDDDDAFDANGVCKPGRTARFPVEVMDSVKRDASLAFDAAGYQSRSFVGARDVVLERARRAAYDELTKRNAEAYKMRPRDQVPEPDDPDDDPDNNGDDQAKRDRAYAAYKRGLDFRSNRMVVGSGPAVVGFGPDGPVGPGPTDGKVTDADLRRLADAAEAQRRKTLEQYCQRAEAAWQGKP
jgi:hypothetical protein